METVKGKLLTKAAVDLGVAAYPRRSLPVHVIFTYFTSAEGSAHVVCAFVTPHLHTGAETIVPEREPVTWTPTATTPATTRSPMTAPMSIRRDKGRLAATADVSEFPI
jgi:hypothetical protein